MDISEGPELRANERENEGTRVSRASFLIRATVGAGVLAGGLTGFLQVLRSAALASAAGGPSIGSNMPIVSRVGLFLGSVASLQTNRALAYKDPKTGDPALVIRLPSGKLVSYDAICPHRGCAVTYDPLRQTIVCPCHGARFDAARNAVPVSGPVSQPLISLPIRIDAAGEVYALDARPGARINRLHAAPPPSAGEDGGDGEDDGRGRKTHGHSGD